MEGPGAAGDFFGLLVLPFSSPAHLNNAQREKQRGGPHNHDPLLKALGQQRRVRFQGGGEGGLYGDEEEDEVRRGEPLELCVALSR